MGLGSFKKKIQPGFIMPVFTYPRPLAKKLRAMKKTNELPEDYGDDRRKDNILDSEKPPPRAVGVVTPDARQHTNTESYNELSDEEKEQIVKIAKTVTVDSANFEYIAKTGRINGGLWMDIQRVVADGYRLALQSKDEEVAGLKMIIDNILNKTESDEDVIIIESGLQIKRLTNDNNKLRAELDKIKTIHYRELSDQLVQDNESLQEQLKAKDEEAEKFPTEYEYWKGRQYQTSCENEELKQKIDSLTSENERLRAVNEELQLFRQKESTAYANLAEKNERLMGLVDRSYKMLKAIQYGVTFGKIEEYQKLITDLSQSTDKQP